MARYFTLADARAKLAEAERAIREVLQSRAVYQESEQKLDALSHRIFMSGGMLVDRTSVELLKTTKETSGQRLQAAAGALEEIGCLIKDLQIGLIDFPTLYRGEEVYLCWRLGEDDISFWHGVHEGFSGRKSIDKEFIDNHSSE